MSTQRNGYRPRELETRLGTLELKIPKLHKDSYFPGFLEPRKTAERALVAVIQEAWIQGALKSRFTPTVRKTTFASSSPSEKFPAEPSATPIAKRATSCSG